MTRKEFNVLENITSHAKRSYTSLIDFIKEICEPCDAEMVISDLKQYMQDSQGDYQSSFRLKIKNNFSK